MNEILKQLHSPTLGTVQMVEGVIRNAKEVLTIAELKRRLPRKVNHNTIKVILSYLQKGGKVEFTPYGVVWVFMPQEAGPAVLTKEKIVRKIEENRSYIKSLGVKKLTLIGSYARGEATDKSDIDFLVEFETGRGLSDDYLRLLHFLQDLFHKEIDLAEASLLREELKKDILEGERVEAQI